jgi:ESS family glutamate:Na+ symporter
LGRKEDCKPVVYEFINTYWQAGWTEIPEILICVIFAAVFIGVEVPPVKAIWEGSGPQIMYGQIVTHGLWFWGLLTGFVLSWLFAEMQRNKWSEFWTGTKEIDGKEITQTFPPCYGMSMYLGFEGGHGTVSGLANDYKDMYKWTDGKDVALAMATTGLVGATLWGVFFINIASRRGWLELKHEGKNELGAVADPMLLVGVYSPESRQPMGYETVVSDSIDTLTLHGAFVGIACFAGYVMKTG